MTERGPKVSETRGKVLARKAKGDQGPCCWGIRRAGGRGGLLVGQVVRKKEKAWEGFGPKKRCGKCRGEMAP